jgi:hypothetical protein
LERDRAAALTLRSAVLGVIDYRDADWHSPMWWKRWRYLIKAIDEQSYEKLLGDMFQFQLALVSNPRISAEDFSATQKEAKEIFADMEGCLRPWRGRSREERSQQEKQTFKEQWQELTGFDPSDKLAVAKWAEEIENVTRSSAEALMKAEQEEKDRQEAFHRRVEEIQLKRLNQQGRKR